MIAVLGCCEVTALCLKRVRVTVGGRDSEAGDDDDDDDDVPMEVR